eukprot:GEMP01037960.1.p2 GENE.GEMP01037960.1~~GEMP01037960.1.p2  ORF type:complete len:205 (-),score=43.21 GEMP01037960.1:50-664(-)
MEASMATIEMKLIPKAVRNASRQLARNGPRIKIAVSSATDVTSPFTIGSTHSVVQLADTSYSWSTPRVPNSPIEHPSRHHNVFTPARRHVWMQCQSKGSRCASAGLRTSELGINCSGFTVEHGIFDLLSLEGLAEVQGFLDLEQKERDDTAGDREQRQGVEGMSVGVTARQGDREENVVDHSEGLSDAWDVDVITCAVRAQNMA